MTDPTGDALRAGKRADARHKLAQFLAEVPNCDNEAYADHLLTIIEASGEYVRVEDYDAQTKRLCELDQQLLPKHPCSTHLPDAEAKARAATRSGVTVLCGKCGGFGWVELTVKDVEE